MNDTHIVPPDPSSGRTPPTKPKTQPGVRGPLALAGVVAICVAAGLVFVPERPGRLAPDRRGLPAVDADKLGKVTGTLTRNGKAVPDAEVVFVAEEGVLLGHLRASGYTDNDGRFTLTLGQTGDPGAVLGSNRVCVTDLRSMPGKGDKKNPAPTEARIPAGYSDPVRTPLRIVVSADGPDFDLDLPDLSGKEKKEGGE